MTALRLVPFVLLAAAAAPRAQTVDVTDYMPLGAFNQWSIVNATDPLDTTSLKVTNVIYEAGVLRYAVTTPYLDQDLIKTRLVMGVDGGNLYLYRVKFDIASIVDEDISAAPIDFDPPLLLGTTSTELGVDSFENAVDTTFEAKVDIGPFSEKVDVITTGTITSSWEPVVADLDTPAGFFPAGDQINWFLEFDLNFTNDGDDFDVDFATVADVRLADGVGFVRLTDPNSAVHVLAAAILQGQTVGDGFSDPGVVLTDLDVPTPGAFTLVGGSDGSTSGGEFQLSGLALDQVLGGNLTLTGTVAPMTTLVGGVPITLTGKSKISKKTGLAKLNLKGKTKQLDLPSGKPLVIKGKGEIGTDPGALTLTYKSGKDVAGEMTLGLTPVADEMVSLAFNPLVDAKFVQKKTRVLGAEGVLSLGGVDFPVTLVEKRKSKEGKPDVHAYTLTQTGTKKKIASFKATSTGTGDFTIVKFKSKLFGLPIVPTDLAELLPIVADD